MLPGWGTSKQSSQRLPVRPCSNYASAGTRHGSSGKLVLETTLSVSLFAHFLSRAPVSAEVGRLRVTPEQFGRRWQLPRRPPCGMPWTPSASSSPLQSIHSQVAGMQRQIRAAKPALTHSCVGCFDRPGHGLWATSIAGLRASMKQEIARIRTCVDTVRL